METEAAADGHDIKLEAEDICPNVIQGQNLSDCQSRSVIPEKKSGENIQAEAELCLKKPEDSFKVPTMPEVKPATSKPTAGGCSITGVATSAEHGAAAATGNLTEASDVDISQNSSSADGFAIPSSVPPRLPATSHARQPRRSALPPSKAGSSAELAGSVTATSAYRPPAWSGCPPAPYSLEVLRGGRIVDTVSLEGRPYVVFGRLVDCDVRLEHPSISRHHAALVYRTVGDDGHATGYYLYDLGSTHGSTLNKVAVQPKVYCRMRVGHMCKFGGSTRLFILQGPEEDREEESDLTVTELKELGHKRQEERQERLERQQETLKELDDESEPVPVPGTAHTAADDGISWGMGDAPPPPPPPPPSSAEDADEESDMQFNPFALGEAENEQLYLVDPKKTLRGWFEREGHELEYQTEELAGGRHVCRVTLPLDTSDGVPPVAEAQHVGKKKEAVFQCALEACRLLDRAGVLRQAKQESRQNRRRKPVGYESDEDDTFLDRTGAVERKRQRRHQAGHAQPKAETYHELLAQYQRVQSEAGAVERRLQQMQSAAPAPAETAADGDELDAFMSRLSQGAFSDRQERRQLRTRLSQLRTEEGRLCRLVNLARPAALPPLKPPPQAAAARSPLTGFIGRRRGKAAPGAVRAAPADQQRPDGAATAGGPPPAPVDQQWPDRAATARGPAPAPVDQQWPDRAATARGPPPAPVDQQWPDRAATARGPPPAPEPDCGTDTDRGHQRSADRRTDTDSAPAPSGAATCRGDTENGRQQAVDGVRTAPAAADEGPRSSVVDRTGRAAAGPTASPQQCQDDPAAKRRRQSTKKQRPKGQATAASYSALAGDGSYDVWMPPEGQSGDGRTSLNDKLGY